MMAMMGGKLQKKRWGEGGGGTGKEDSGSILQTSKKKKKWGNVLPPPSTTQQCSRALHKISHTAGTIGVGRLTHMQIGKNPRGSKPKKKNENVRIKILQRGDETKEKVQKTGGLTEQG